MFWICLIGVGPLYFLDDHIFESLRFPGNITVLKLSPISCLYTNFPLDTNHEHVWKRFVNEQQSANRLNDRGMKSARLFSRLDFEWPYANVTIDLFWFVWRHYQYFNSKNLFIVACHRHTAKHLLKHFAGIAFAAFVFDLAGSGVFPEAPWRRCHNTMQKIVGPMPFWDASLDHLGSLHFVYLVDVYFYAHFWHRFDIHFWGLDRMLGSFRGPCWGHYAFLCVDAAICVNIHQVPWAIVLVFGNGGFRVPLSLQFSWGSLDVAGWLEMCFYDVCGFVCKGVLVYVHFRRLCKFR